MSVAPEQGEKHYLLACFCVNLFNNRRDKSAERQSQSHVLVLKGWPILLIYDAL